MWRLTAVILSVLLAGCGTSQSPAPAPELLPEPAPVEDPVAQCSEPRPEVCTMEYNPVCAQLADGTASDYSSPCNACADDSVSGYLPGICAGD